MLSVNAQRGSVGVRSGPGRRGVGPSGVVRISWADCRNRDDAIPTVTDGKGSGDRWTTTKCQCRVRPNSQARGVGQRHRCEGEHVMVGVRDPRPIWAGAFPAIAIGARLVRRNRAIPVAESLHGQVRRHARNSNARLHYGALPGPTPNVVLASKISLDREHITSYHHARGRRGSGPRKAFPAPNPPTRQRTNGLIARRPMAG